MGRKIKSRESIGWQFFKRKKKKHFVTCPGGGVAQSTSHSPRGQKTRVRIPPGYRLGILRSLCKADDVHDRINLQRFCVEKDK
jgi:hypothetical protein